MKKTLFLNCFLICIVFFFSSFKHPTKPKQDEKKKEIKFQFESGYLFGGQLYNDNFIYNPGFKFGLGAYKKIYKRTMLGISSGYYSFSESENFIPIKLELIGKTRKDENSPYLNFSLGYAYGWDQDIEKLKNYDYNGGMQIGAGFGRKIEMNSLDLYLGLYYEHQFAKLRYDLYEIGSYTETLNYDWVAINCKIMF